MKNLLRLILNSSLFKTSGVYTVANLMNAAVPFLLLPILTNYLSTADYGAIAIYMALLSFTVPLVGINSQNALTAFYFKEKNFDIGQFVGNGIIILIFSSFVTLGLFLLFSKYLEQFTLLPSFWILTAVIMASCLFINKMILSIWQIKNKPYRYSLFVIGSSVMNFGLTTIFIVYLSKSWTGRIEGQLIAYGIFALLALTILYSNKWLKINFNLTTIKRILYFGIPLIPHTIGGIALNTTDKFIINSLVSQSETGIYSLAFQVGSVITILCSSFNIAFVPWLFERLNKGEEATKRNIVKLTYFYFFALIITAFFALIALRFIFPFIVGDDFKGSALFLGWIITGFVFNGMYMMITNYIFFVEKTYILAITTFCFAILNVPLCYYFVKTNGTIGAAQSNAIITFLFFIVTWIISSRVYPMPWKLFSFAKKT